MEAEQKTRKKPNRFSKWFFFDRFSYFDLIIIFGVVVPILNWVLSHLNVGWS